MRIGVALGGGGLTGTAFHAGVLCALVEEVGWDARDAAVLVGTSAGSTAAALMRTGFPPRDYVRRMTGRPMSAEGESILGAMPSLTDPLPGTRVQRRPAAPDLARAVARRPWRYRPGVAAAALLPAGTRPADPGAARLRSLFPAWPARSLWICAVDLGDGQRVVFGRDASASVGDAVAASCAVPGYFEPVVVDGRRYVDGGAYSLVSLDLLAGLGLDTVVVSAPLSTLDWVAADPGNVPRVLARAQLEREAARVRRSGTRVVVVQPDARMRRIMGTNTMVAAKRAPVAVAARDFARSLLRDQAPWLGR